ncbi:lysophospholipid acyltransferase family protein [Pelagibius marinus]|uniref:lysophospholipid acyltransferase family protein n=1 Tax=Pelagibius marinus TaxID=2762760 RepID=UPI0018721C90|nr:lysophospholipid acyltransferase family protein [Pelagibius marinus]
MTALRSFLFNVFFYGWTALCVIVGLPLLLGPRKGIYVLGRVWSHPILAALRLICGLKHQVRGRENLPEGPVLIAAKHQSAWDTIIFSILLWDHSFVLKQELMRIPLFGLYLWRAGLIPVDRRGGAKALRKMVAAAKRVAAQGRPMVIFPEGTRVAPEQQRPYQPGVAALYGQLQVPVVPVALNSGLFWRRNSFWKLPGTITLEFLPQIPPGLQRKDFLARLEQAIEGRSRALAGASSAPLTGPAPESAAQSGIESKSPAQK